MAELKKMTEDEIQSIVSDAVSDAVDFVESEIAHQRIKAQRYYDGETDIGEEEGRSNVVSTKVRDVVRQAKPSLMRIFLSNDKAVEYTPAGPNDVDSADQSTRYGHLKFEECNGKVLLDEAIHDALLKKTGFMKAYWDNHDEGEIYDFSNLTEEELAVIVSDKDITVLEQSVEMCMEADQFGIEIEMPRYEIKVQKRKKTGNLRIETIPPEEMFVDRSAKSIDDFYVICQRSEMTVSDLVAMGYEYDVVSELSGASDDETIKDEEKFTRNSYQEDDEENVKDPSMRLVSVTEAYMKIDVHGTGIATMHRFILGGGEKKLLSYEPWGLVPFAVFEVDPEPHSFYGNSVADITIDDQDTATAMLRGMLDNVALTNNPAIDVVDGQANIDDLLNNEIGAIRRVKSQGAITVNQIPFVAGQTLSAIQYMDDLVETKTGVTKASMGLDPDALQNATATATALTAQRGAGQIEVMAKNLAEGGMKRLFKIILHLLVENSEEETMMRINGEYVPIDPRSWNAEMGITVNVGLGTGKEDEKVMALEATFQKQQAIWQTYGPMNGIVTMTGMRNTLADILAISGLRNADRYYEPMTAQKEQQLIAQQQQMQAQQAQQPDPLVQATIQAETIKAQAKVQSDTLNAQTRAMAEIAKDDRERDKMDQDLFIDTAKVLGEYGSKVDVERIKQMQNEPRYPDVSPQQAVTQGNY